MDISSKMVFYNVSAKKAAEPGADILCPNSDHRRPLAQTIIQNPVQNSLKSFCNDAQIKK